MAYIAQVSNQSGSYQIVTWREGQLSDIATSDQPNWRQVTENYPFFDSLTQTQGPLTITVASDGAVNATRPVVDYPDYWDKYRLKQYADAVATEALLAGFMLPNGVKLGTSTDSLTRLLFGVIAANAGMITEALPVLTQNGWQEVGATDFQNMFGALWLRGVSIYVKWKALHDAIDAGTVASKAAVDAYQWQ